MKALTLWPEWAAAIAFLGKLVENRAWHPGRAFVGQRIAIHAGAHVGGRPGRVAAYEGLEALEGTASWAGWDLDRTVPRFEEVVREGKQLSRMVFGRDGREGGLDVPVARKAIVCTAVLLGADTEQRTPWDVQGGVHWRLGDVRRLEVAVPCKGAQGLWTVLDDVLDRVRAQGGCS